MMPVRDLKDCLQGLDWFWEMLKLVLSSAVAPGRTLPKIVFYEHLSHLSRDTWLGFERALVVHNRCIVSILIDYFPCSCKRKLLGIWELCTLLGAPFHACKGGVGRSQSTRLQS